MAYKYAYGLVSVASIQHICNALRHINNYIYRHCGKFYNSRSLVRNRIYDRMQSGSFPCKSRSVVAWVAATHATTDLDLQQMCMETMFENRKAWKEFLLLPAFGK